MRHAVVCGCMCMYVCVSAGDSRNPASKKNLFINAAALLPRNNKTKQAAATTTTLKEKQQQQQQE